MEKQNKKFKEYIIIIKHQKKLKALTPEYQKSDKIKDFHLHIIFSWLLMMHLL
jgi:hypothetical protein